MTKYSEMVLDPMRIRFCLEKALYLAQTGRPGPVLAGHPVKCPGRVYRDGILCWDSTKMITRRAAPAGRTWNRMFRLHDLHDE